MMLSWMLCLTPDVIVPHYGCSFSSLILLYLTPHVVVLVGSVEGEPEVRLVAQGRAQQVWQHAQH